MMKLELEIRHYNCPKENGDLTPAFQTIHSGFIGIHQLRCPKCDCLITVKLEELLLPDLQQRGTDTAGDE